MRGVAWLPVCLILLATAPEAVAEGAWPATEVRFYDDAAIDDWRRAALRRLEDRAARRCHREVVGHDTIEGPADAAQRAIVFPTGTLAACFERTRRLGDLVAAVAARTKPARRLDARCGEAVAAAFGRAAAHQDACSVLRPGVTAIPESFLPLLRLSRLAVLRAALLAEAGRRREALRLLLDLVVVSRDLRRGGVPLITHTFSTAVARMALDEARRRLAEAPPDEPEGRALQAALDVVLEAPPLVSDLLAAEAETMAVAHGLGPLVPPEWAPPGGWPGFEVRTLPYMEDPHETWPRRHDLREVAATFLVAQMGLARALDRRCARDPMEGCWAQYGDLLDEAEASRAALRLRADAESHAAWALLVEPGQGASARFDLAVALVEGGEDPDRVRAALETLHTELLPDLREQAAEALSSQAEVAALRVHVELWRRGGEHPSKGDWSRPPLAHLLRPPGVETPLSVRAVEGGSEVVLPPWGARGAFGNGPPPPWFVPCTPR